VAVELADGLDEAGDRDDAFDGGGESFS